MTRIERVEDLASPGVAPYASLRDRDLRGRQDVFVAEGEVTVRVLATRSHFRVRSLLLSEKRVESMRDVLEALDDDVTAYVAPQPIMDGIVGFAIHRGVLALAERGAPRDARELLASIPVGPALVVGLSGITNHDNVGGIFRNAAGFGVRAVLVDHETCDPLYRKSVRVSVGGALVVPFAKVGDAHDIIDVAKASGFEPLALSPRGHEELAAVSAPRAMLLLGAEGPGLPEHVLARARTVRVDMQGELDSLNVAVTSGIALYLASRARTSHH